MTRADGQGCCEHPPTCFLRAPEGKPTPPESQQGWTHCQDPQLPLHQHPHPLAAPKGSAPGSSFPVWLSLPTLRGERPWVFPPVTPCLSGDPHSPCPTWPECRERGREMKRKMGRHQPLCPQPLPHLLVPLAAAAVRDPPGPVIWQGIDLSAPPHCPPSTDPRPGCPGLLYHPLGSQGGAGER